MNGYMSEESYHHSPVMLRKMLIWNHIIAGDAQLKIEKIVCNFESQIHRCETGLYHFKKYYNYGC